MFAHTHDAGELNQLNSEANLEWLIPAAQWLLIPTLENYQRIPDMMKPTPTQCMIPHIGAIETIPL